MKKITLYSCVLLLLIALSGTAQVNNDSAIAVHVSGKPVISNLETRQLFPRKGKFFFYWGYNRSAYTNSNIHLTGDGYDFTIANVAAKDEPVTDFQIYVNPTHMSVPQYDYRIGYYLNDKTFISVGEDHMKYAIYKQSTRLTGYVTKDNNEGKNIGTYNNTEVLVGEGDGADGTVTILDSLPKGFVSGFEHCDGLNDVSVEIGRLEQLWISKNNRMALAVVGTCGVGMVIPDTDADILGYQPKHDMENGQKSYHLAGYSFSGSFGLQFDFSPSFFLLTKIKGGYMNLPDINTTMVGGKASQHFTFIESMLVVGYNHAFGK